MPLDAKMITSMISTYFFNRLFPTPSFLLDEIHVNSTEFRNQKGGIGTHVNLTIAVGKEWGEKNMLLCLAAVPVTIIL